MDPPREPLTLKPVLVALWAAWATSEVIASTFDVLPSLLSHVGMPDPVWLVVTFPFTAPLSFLVSMGFVSAVPVIWLLGHKWPWSGHPGQYVLASLVGLPLALLDLVTVVALGESYAILVLAFPISLVLAHAVVMRRRASTDRAMPQS